MEMTHSVGSILVRGFLWWLIPINRVGRFTHLASCSRVWDELLFCLLVSTGIKKLNIGSWSVRCLKGFMTFARSLYRWSSHFAIASLFLLCIISWTANLDLSINASLLGASYQFFTCRCNRFLCSLYWSFLDPNNVWRRLGQHALLQFINILRNPGIHFLFSGVLMDAQLIENLCWKASSRPSSTREENASLTCSLTVLSSKNVATFRSILGPSSLPLQFSPWCDSASDVITSIPSSNALRRWSPTRQARKWAVSCGRYSSCVWARDGQPVMCAIVSILLDWQHLHVGLRSLLNIWAWASVYHWLMKLLHAWTLDNAVDVNDSKAMW